MDTSVKERLRHEVGGILLVAAGIFLFLSLVSYHPMDPSFFTYASKAGEIHNWMGVVGAYLSSLFFQGSRIAIFDPRFSILNMLATC